MACWFTIYGPKDGVGVECSCCEYIEGVLISRKETRVTKVGVGLVNFLKFLDFFFYGDKHTKNSKIVFGYVHPSKVVKI